MSKDEVVVEVLLGLVEALDMVSILLYHRLELRPGCATNVTLALPGMKNRLTSFGTAAIFIGLPIEEAHDPADIVHPGIPVLPYCWSTLALIVE